MGRINLTRIYTRLGDGGETHLGDMSRVSKVHPRIEAYGTVDELSAQLGVLLANATDLPDPVRTLLVHVQNDLFDVGADLCVPDSEEGRERLRVSEDQTAWLERHCDEWNERLEPLTSFVLPGGTPAAAQMHVCRTVCRRAERRALAVEDVSPPVIQYLNRLSDLLFILSRAVNDPEREQLWVPGQHRTGDD
jgi:cob(I)alamin adenosyltransferase